ncbi:MULTISPECIES: hypothetical protein [unclassified Streptomyces]|uniref:hypothetical protein n=2 Tax=Streptomyces TaxID=1883 RepID=UPI00115FDE71|nr:MULTISPECIES: hypothetical protein [unclassified Streptomyces]
MLLVMGTSARCSARPRTVLLVTSAGRNGAGAGAVFPLDRSSRTPGVPMTETVVGVIVAAVLVGYLALAVAYPKRF